MGVEEIIARVQPEEALALESEPQSPQLYLALGRLYQKAAESDPRYIGRAREYVDAAQKLAPEYKDTLMLMVAQEILEKDYQGALDIAERYAAYGTSYQFEVESRDMRRIAKEALAGQKR